MCGKPAQLLRPSPRRLEVPFTLLNFWLSRHQPLPDVPWNPLLYLSVLVTIVVPVLVFPHTKTLYLAIDLAFRPPEPPDLATPAEPSLVTPRRPKER